MIPESLLTKFINFGNTNDFSQINSLLSSQEQEKYSYIMRLRPDPWFDVADKLRREEIASLIKSLTLIESNYTGWKGGSVSPVILLFKKLVSIDQNFSNEIADWVLANTDNDYLPFGSFNFGGKSLVELEMLRKLSSERKSARYEAEKERQELARKRKAQKATLALTNAVKRNDVHAVKALIEKGADIHVKDSEGISVFEHALIKNNEKILELLKSIDKASDLKTQ